MLKAIKFLTIALIMFFTPYLLKQMIDYTLFDLTGKQTTYTTLNLNVTLNSLINIISITSYITFIVFIIKSIFAFKEYYEFGNTIYSDRYTKNQNINLNKEKIVQIDKELFKFNLDFYNESLNKKLLDIEKIINFIISLPILKNDIENKLLISATQTKYVTKIHQSYITIPKERREQIVQNSTATNLTMEQLVLIENGLIEIENKLLSEQLKGLNVMKKFLKEKFP